MSREGLGVVSNKLLDSDFKGALLSSEDHIAYKNKAAYPEQFYRYSKEVFSTFNLCIYMNRKSCLVQQIDKYIQKLRSNGLIKRWADKVVDR